MRGNLVGVLGGFALGGPIPAHAGQPRPCCRSPIAAGAYPRACGATLRQSGGEGHLLGLSPRMRGNRARHRGAARAAGPIPAHAGQPRCAPPGHALHGAYPRACGATHCLSVPATCSKGLSPRMRGNPAHGLRDDLGGGPIPAHAGQPASCCCQAARPRAYPRACGATPGTRSSYWSNWGLSPRMRGNRRCFGSVQRLPGPIPAHAGQPQAARSLRWMPRAYPRACGAT